MKKIIFLLLTLFLAASCGSDDEDISPGRKKQDGGEIKLEFAFANGNELRVSVGSDFKNTWQPGDQVGVYIVEGSSGLQASGNYWNNVPVTFDGTSWTYSAPAGKEYFPAGSLSFYAYYPYDTFMSDPLIADPLNYLYTARADQSTTAGFEKSIFLTAKQENVAKTDNSIVLQFSHAMSLLQVEMAREVNMPHFKDNLQLTLKGAMTEVRLDWVSPGAEGSQTDIIMHKVEGLDYTYRALVPAQTLATDAKVTIVQAGTPEEEIDREYNGLQSASLDAGRVHKYRVTLGYGIDEQHEYAVGDVYPHIGPAMGIVYWLENPVDGKSRHGKAVGLVNQNTKWIYQSSLRASTGAMDGINGRVNMLTVNRFLQINGYPLQNYPVFEWVQEFNSLNETYDDPAAKGVWYLPAIEELKELYAGYSGKVYEEMFWEDTSRMPGDDDQACVDARLAFDTKRINAGGSAMVPMTTQYWMSSTELDEYSYILLKPSSSQITVLPKDDIHTAIPVIAF